MTIEQPGTNQIMKYILVSFLSLSGFFSFSQQKIIDSLYVQLDLISNDTDRINILNAISFQLRNEKPDSSFFYAETALELSEKLNWKKGCASSWNNIGEYYRVKGDYPKALEFTFRAVKSWENLLQELRINSGKKKADLTLAERSLLKNHSSSLSNIGIIYWNQGNYPKALEFLLSALQGSEELNDPDENARIFANIGVLYWNMGDYPKSLDYSFKAMKIAEQRNNSFLLSSALSNIGNVYFEQHDYSQALDYYHRALKINEESGDNYQVALVLGNIASVYGMLGEYDKSLDHFLKVLPIARSIGDQIGIAFSLNNIGIMLIKETDSVNSLPEKIRAEKIKKAEEYLLAGLTQSDSIGAIDLQEEAHEALSNLYSKTGNLSRAFYHYKKHVELKDSLFSKDRSKEIGKLEAKFDYDKQKALADAEHLKDLELAEEREKRQQIFIFLIAAVAIAVAVIAFIIFRTLRITKKQKKTIEEQKHVVEEHQKEITDSIKYASRLQNAILPPAELMKKNFPDSFLFYKPKDIVAGDFYWIAHINPPDLSRTESREGGTSISQADSIEHGLLRSSSEGRGFGPIFIAAADCTGHGVPGALVSIVCSNALNRAVKEFGLNDTGKILDKVTDLVLETFEKSGEQIKDGMDISLLKIEFFHSVVSLQWSGANNPLWYITTPNFPKGGLAKTAEIIEIKADKQPVGKYDFRKPFTSHNIKLPSSPKESGVLRTDYGLPTTFYLFTDGLPDQFGGPKGKKFMYKQFKENLLANSALTMEEQKEKLEKDFELWKGSLEQVDDVTVIGIRI